MITKRIGFSTLSMIRYDAATPTIPHWSPTGNATSVDDHGDDRPVKLPVGPPDGDGERAHERNQDVRDRHRGDELKGNDRVCPRLTKDRRHRDGSDENGECHCRKDGE